VAKTLLTSKGAPVVLGRELGKGGEGSVYEIPALPNAVAKLYHKPPDPKKQAKLSFMAATADAQLLNYVAWPQETLHPGRGGPVVGFLIPKVVGKKPIHMVYSPAHRRHDYPKAAWYFLLYVARNIGASFATVQAHGHVIGDINQNSVLVGGDSKVVLIDSDSFQVNAGGTLHLCEVGVAHFTPPELQSLSSFHGFARTINHDNFGLALLIFHVLFGGRHPYSGVPLRPGVGDALEKDIKKFLYAYARDNQSRGFRPPPRSIPISILPDQIEAMFHFAFTERGASSARPTAQQWVSVLDGLRSHLKKCGTSAMHVYPDHLAKCPWCTLDQQGIVYFLDLGATFTPGASGFVLTQVWGLIQAVQAPPPVSIPDPSSFSVTAQPLPPDIAGGRSVAIYKLVAVAIAIVVGFSGGEVAWILGLIVGWGGWMMAENVDAAERASEAKKRRGALESAKIEYEQLVNRAKKEAGPEGFHARKAELLKLREELDNMPRAEKEEIDKLLSTAHERQKQKFLDTCFLDSANIAGVGPARKASLRSFGIETAADVTKSRVMQVQGFGESLTRAVLDWKASCERGFRFNPATAVSGADRSAVRAKYAAKQAIVERILAAAPAQLNQFRQKSHVRFASLKPRLEVAAQNLAQAQADYSLVE
jgi:DNA-binding helix-hairpin-helix protein with protein kinase domain